MSWLQHRERSNQFCKDGSHLVRINVLKMKDEISGIGNLDWDKELRHWVRRKPRGMAVMRVNVRVLVEDQKYWHPNKKLINHWPHVNSKPGGVNLLKCVPDTGGLC